MLRLFLLAAATSCFVSCTHVRETCETYLPAAPPEKIRAASIGGHFDPTDGDAGLSLTAMVYSVSSGKRFGPYDFALYAIGQANQQKSLTLHSLIFRSATGKSEAVPSSYLNRPILFAPTLRDGITQATWHLPGHVTLDFAKETSATLTARLTITDATGSQTKTLTLPFERRTTKTTTFYNVGIEIYRQMKHRGVPFDDLEIGANQRDWKP